MAKNNYGITWAISDLELLVSKLTGSMKIKAVSPEFTVTTTKEKFIVVNISCSKEDFPLLNSLSIQCI